MNRRIYKKLCKRAMATLIEKHGYKAKDFDTVKFREEVSWDAPLNMEWSSEPWYSGHSAGFFSPLKGTPGHWAKVSYEENEWDFKSPIEILDQIEIWEAHGREIDAIGFEAWLAKYEEKVPE